MPVDPEEVETIVRNLKNSKSCGTDNISTDIIKLILPSILPPLTHIINLSLMKSSFPKSWKHSKVTPLLKKNCPLEKSNYRPISNLNILSKNLERVAYRKLSKYLEDNNLIHQNHHGGREAHNTASAMTQMYDQWVEEVEEGKMVGTMLVDQSGA